MQPNSALSLADHLARRRSIYPAPVPTVPRMLAIDVPLGSRGRGLLLDRYYAVILETDQEQGEFERFLAEPAPGRIRPDLLDLRPSQLWSDDILLIGYAPPASGWPWLSLTRWNDGCRDAALAQNIAMARGCYTMEAFEDFEALTSHQTVLLESLGMRGLAIRLFSADRISPATRMAQ